jgi:uncharacterized protein (DUF885 family)
VKRLLPLLLAACASTPPASRELDRLGRDYWEWRMASSPEWATYRGDHRWNDRLTDVGARGRERGRQALEGFLARLRAIDRAALPGAARVSAEILERELVLGLEEREHAFWQWAVDPMDGPQVTLLELVNSHPFRDAKDMRDFIARIRAIPRHLDDHIANLREGLKEGRVAPKVIVDRVVGQLRAIRGTPPEKLAFADALRKSDAFHEELLEAVASDAKPAFGRLLDFLEKEYRAREAPGLGALPGGEAAYRFRIRWHTTTELPAKEIHEIGLAELRGIQEEMRAIARKLGHDGDLPSFFAKVKGDPANYRASRAELLEHYRAALAKAEAALPEWFSRLPKIPCKVKEIEAYREKDAPTAYYYAADEKRTRDAFFYANLYQPETRPLYSAMALTVHEAVPGHHLQIAIAQELEGLPEFRRSASSTAFVEGWALYTERLADEMGLYATDLERFGMLSYQAWRASRLVVDTGLHAMGWSRERAIRFMLENVADSEQNLTNEVDRYITWPGQALAYKIGQREILALRAEAREKLGERFDIREFHDVVLRNGPVPLPVLGRLVREWIGSATSRDQR